MTELMDAGSLTAEQRVRADDRSHVFHSWSAQALIDPMPIASASGSYFWDYAGKRYLDFSSQLVNVNIGYQHPTLVAAIKEQADRLCTVGPTFANDVRGEAARLIAELAPGDLNHVFFTNGGAEATENAIRMARLHTGRHKVLAAYRSYHGATAGAIALTGDPRRWPAEPGAPAPCATGARISTGPPSTPAPKRRSRSGPCSTCVTSSRSRARTPSRRSSSKPWWAPTASWCRRMGYLAGVRAICDEFGIVMIADEVMAGFGRCGEWFAVDHWEVTPDLITFAKGVNSGYVPLGGVIISRAIAETFAKRPFPGGLTYSGHPLACASAVASIGIFKDEGILEHARMLGEKVIGPGLRELAATPSVGRGGSRPRRLLGGRAGPGPGQPATAGALQRQRARCGTHERIRRPVQGTGPVAVRPFQPAARGAPVHHHGRTGRRRDRHPG